MKKLLKTVRRSLVVAFLGVLILLVPYVQFPLLFLSGLLTAYDFLWPGETIFRSPHVLIHFWGFGIQSANAFAFFGSFIFLLSLFVESIRHCLKYIFARLRVKLPTFISYVLGILFVIGLSTLLHNMNYQLMSQSELARTNTSTETHFTCSEELALDVTPTGDIEVYVAMKDESTNSIGHQTLSIGNIDFETAVLNPYYFQENTSGMASAYVDKIHSSIRYAVENCKNVQGKTLLQKYPIP